MAKDYLSHHGIQGQKWGVRNGPPYPLYSKSRLGRGESLTSQTLDKYKNQYNNLKHVKITDNTNGRIYTKNGKVVAMVNTEKKPDGSVWIQGLEVFGDNKRKGLGKELLNVAVNDLGATHLSVRKTNSIAKHLYDNYGFKTYDSDDFMDYMKYDNLNHSDVDDYLSQHGIQGQKWGVRRFQNPDGSLTAAGKRRIKQEFSKRLDSDIEYEKKLNSELSKKGIVRNKNGTVLKKNSTLGRYSTNNNERIEGNKYTYLTDIDKKYYHEMASNDLLGFKSHDKIYNYKLKNTSDLKIAEGEDVVNYLVKEYGDTQVKSLWKEYKKN